MSIAISSPSATSYDGVQRALHWIMAALIFLAIAAGVGATFLEKGSPERAQMFMIHRSLGMTALMLVAFRVVYRLLVGRATLRRTARAADESRRECRAFRSLFSDGCASRHRLSQYRRRRAARSLVRPVRMAEHRPAEQVARRFRDAGALLAGLGDRGGLGAAFGGGSLAPLHQARRRPRADVALSRRARRA